MIAIVMPEWFTWALIGLVASDLILDIYIKF